MSNEDDFRIDAACGFEPPDQPSDFKVSSITGVAGPLESDFELHGIHPEEPDFLIHEEPDFRTDAVRERQPIRKEMPNPKDYVVVGELDLEGIPVFIDAITYRAMEAHLLSLTNTPTPLREMGGAPIGKYCVDARGRLFTVNLAFIPFAAPSNAGEIEIPPEEWLRAHLLADKLSAKGVEVGILGWSHSHPGFLPAPSDIDVSITNTHFNRPFMVAMIFDPLKKRIGVYELDGQGGLRNKGGFAIIGDGRRQLAREIYYCSSQHL